MALCFASGAPLLLRAVARPAAPLRAKLASRAPRACAPKSFKHDAFYMHAALRHARNAFAQREVPIGAVLVDSTGAIVSAAHNLVESTADCTQHAEMVCIQRAMAHRAAWRLNDTVLYCTLEPCAMCLSALLLARVRRVVYGAKDLRLGACGTWIDLTRETHPFHSFDEVVGGVLEHQSSALLRRFFQQRRSEAKSNKKPLQ